MNEDNFNQQSLGNYTSLAAVSSRQIHEFCEHVCTVEPIWKDQSPLKQVAFDDGFN